MSIEQFIIPGLSGIAVVFLVLCLLMFIKSSKKVKAHTLALKTFLSKKKEKEEENLNEIKKSIETLAFPDEKTEEVLGLYANNEKCYYVDLIDILMKNDYSKLATLDTIMQKQVKEMINKILTIQSELQVMEEPNEQEQSENAVDEVNNDDADLDIDDIDQLMKDTQDADVQEEPQPQSVSPEIVTELEVEIARLKDENQKQVKKETEIRRLLDDVLAEFCRMFNITRESISSLSLDEIRSMVLGKKKA